MSRASPLFLALVAPLAVACDAAVEGRPDNARDGAREDGGDSAAPAPFEDALVAGEEPWRDRVAAALDKTLLGAAFFAGSWGPPEGTEIYAAKVERTALGLAYAFYEWNDGAFSEAFWPASTVKVHAALAALDFVASQGFTGEATVAWASGFEDRVNSIVERAVRVSSNEDYDRTIRIAGFDQLNATWLSPERGFPATIIKGAYAGFEVVNPPGYRLTEGDAMVDVPARAATGAYPCASGRSNCANLFELTEAVRRVVLDAELPEAERFALPAGDHENLRTALCTATPSFFAAGVTAALGAGATVCHKPGWVPGRDSLDHGVVEAADGSLYLLAAAVPDPGDSSSQAILAEVAEHTLLALKDAAPTGWLEHDGGVFIAARLDGTTLRAHASGASRMTARWGGTTTELDATQPAGTFEVLLDAAPAPGTSIALRAFGAGGTTLIATRSGTFP